MPPATISRRRFVSPYWDKPAAGFEQTGVLKYKEMQSAGQVPQTVVNPSSSHLQGTKFARPRSGDPMEAVRAAAAVINATLSIKPSTQSRSGAPGAAPSLTRQARRLYIGNIPFGCTDAELAEFFRSNMEACNFIKEPGDPVLACQINLDKNFAFMEFRTMDETASALALDGILCKGQALKVRRPHDYQPVAGSEPLSGQALAGSRAQLLHSSAAPSIEVHIPGVVSTSVADSANKIYIGGIPTYLTDDQMKEILTSFGQLRAFNLIRDPATLASKGYAFCEYLEPAKTEAAILGLNGFDIGDKKLVVQRASVGSKLGAPGCGPAPAAALANPIVQVLGLSSANQAMAPVQIQVPGMASLTPASSVPRVLTEVLCLMNMVEPEELRDDQEFSDIIEDILSECQKYGRVRSIEIPRPRKDSSSSQVPGLGKVFVEFDSATEAQRAQVNLAGRRFANRVVVTSYFDRERYKNKEF